MTRLLTVPLLLALLLPASAFARGFGERPHFDLDRREAPVLRHSEDIDPSTLTLDEKRKIQKSLQIRRKMVDVHTILAFSTAGLLVATELVGVVNSRFLETPPSTYKRADLEPSLILHRTLATAALTTYWSAGVVAWTMPPAYRFSQEKAGKPTGFDSGQAHAILSIIHGIAMGTVLVTGILQANVIPASDAWSAVETTHAVAGVTAAGTVIAAAIVIGTL